MNVEKICYILYLQKIFNYNYRKINEFLTYYPSAETGYSYISEKGFSDSSFLPKSYEYHKGLSPAKEEDTVNWCERENIDIITVFDKNYPFLLNKSSMQIPIIFVKGKIPDTENIPSVSFIGTRSCSREGGDFCTRMAYGISLHSFTVASGTSSGINACALRGALANNDSKPIAVLPCSIDSVYPRENEYLCDKVSERGAVVSPFPPTASLPPSQAFQIANRLLVSITGGTVLFEASAKSGSLAAAAMALEENRLTFAVPGNARDPLSEGANNLLKAGAEVCTGLNDIIDVYNPLFGGKIKKIDNKGRKREIEKIKKQKTLEIQEKLKTLSPVEQRIYTLTQVPVSVDEICEELNISFPQAVELLSDLEIKGFVKETEKGYLRVCPY